MSLGTVRMIFECTPEGYQHWNELKEDLGVKTDQELFDAGIEILKKSVETVQSGQEVAAVDVPGQKYSVLQMDALDYARNHGSAPVRKTRFHRIKGALAHLGLGKGPL